MLIKKIKIIIFIYTLTSLFGCASDDSASFSLLPDKDVFHQNVESVNTTVDILWVIDNSGSMKSSQDNIALNFQSFIDSFTSKNFDFKMAVTTTDAYKTLYGQDQTYSEFRDGTSNTSFTGIKVIEPNTPNLIDTFLINMLQGINGYGDERAFQSLEVTLNNPLNSGFVRPDGFLAVIIVSDEDDFSHDSSFWSEDQTRDDMFDIDYYVSYLDQLTNSSGVTRKYSVSTMSILDEDCRTELTTSSWTGRKIGVRYSELVDATGGTKGSLCGEFANELELISQNIIQLATQFYLKRIPIPESIVVTVNDIQIPNFENNPSGEGGWKYNSDANSILFTGSFIPEQGATIAINYDPLNFD